jgi:hypothetical protein
MKKNKYSNGGGVGYSPMNRYDRIRYFMNNLGFEVDAIEPTDTSVGIFNGYVIYKKRDDKNDNYFEVPYDELWYYVNHNGTKKDVIKDSIPFNDFAKGGGIKNENELMVANNNKQIAHHTEEMKEALKKANHVPAWVVAKVNRSASDLSDATHYLEGAEGMYATGGGVDEDFADLYGGDVFLLSKGYKNPTEVFFQVGDRVFEVTQAQKGLKNIGIFYYTENFNNQIDKEVLNKINSDFGNDFTITLYTNAGVDLHSSSKGKYKNIQTERLKGNYSVGYSVGGGIYADGGGMEENLTPVELYFRNLDYSKLPESFSNFIKTEILTDPELKYLSEREPIFVEIKEKVEKYENQNSAKVEEEESIADLIVGLEVLVPISTKKEQKELLDLIEGLKLLL